jgi:hypothetical protein
MATVTLPCTYTGDLLLAYISRLSPKYVIFRTGDKLDRWIEAGVFAALLAKPVRYTYDDLIREIHGLRTEVILRTASAREALEQMQLCIWIAFRPSIVIIISNFY